MPEKVVIGMNDMKMLKLCRHALFAADENNLPAAVRELTEILNKMNMGRDGTILSANPALRLVLSIIKERIPNLGTSEQERELCLEMRNYLETKIRTGGSDGD